MSAVGRRFAIADDSIASAAPTELVDAVTEAAKGLRFGSIEVVVHDRELATRILNAAGGN